MKIHVTLVIPTKDRAFDITRLLVSIAEQERLPDDVIIVDGSAESIQELVEGFTTLPIRYFRCVPPSLPRQRNYAIRELLPETDWVGFLDDDLELLPHTLKNLENFISENKEQKMGGIGLSILNQPLPKAGFLNTFFLLDKGKGGKITLSGFPSSIRIYNKPRRVDWLYGGATFWTKKVLKTYSFDEWFSGTGYMEDVDFSYHVSQDHPLWISMAPCYHYSHPISILKERALGEWQICSLWYFSQKTKDFSSILTSWSCLGIIFKSALVSVIQLDYGRWLRFLGNCKGFLRILNYSYKKPLVFSK